MMAEKIDEGVLYDLLTKRRAGHCTADVILWAADHGDMVRGLRAGTLIIAPATSQSVEPEQTAQVVSDWQKLFGHLRVLDSGFNEANFPLEPEAELRGVVEKRFTGIATGYNRFCWAESWGLVLAKPRATGLYLRAHPELQLTNLVIGGGRWRHGSSGYVPLFSWNGRQPSVGLVWLDKDFDPNCVWLFSLK